MRVAKALRIVVETAKPRCDGAVLARIDALAAAAPPLLSLSIDDCAGAPQVLAALPAPAHASQHHLADALHHACSAALAHIPPIDQRATRSRAKRALRAVAAIQRLARTLAAARAA